MSPSAGAHAHRVVALLHTVDTGRGQDLDALLLQPALHDRGDLLVLAREDAVERLDELYARAEAREA